MNKINARIGFTVAYIVAIAGVIWLKVDVGWEDGWEPFIVSLTSITFLAGLSSLHSFTPQNPARSDEKGVIDGTYCADGNPHYVIDIRLIYSNMYQISNKEWYGVGFFVAGEYWGFYKVNEVAREELKERWGLHHGIYNLADKSIQLWGQEFKRREMQNNYRGQWIAQSD